MKKKMLVGVGTRNCVLCIQTQSASRHFNTAN
uniref:Uncharacterized protein n=1 Tax=Anguilla anguilla TaxID=7936 RepID=A0A0E9T831_ANGAN